MPLAPLVVIGGPTASGKSELAIDVAERFGGDIINYDSLQLYRYLNIGTAKSPPAARRGIPHHLLDLLNPDQVFTAGDYARAADEVLTGVTGRGRVPVMVGGTGFYLHALLNGLFQGPRRDEALRARLNRRSGERLHRILGRYDSVAAGRIHPNDKQKLIRAVEVCLRARRPMTEMFSQSEQPLAGYSILKLALDPPRQELYERINQRTLKMFEGGLLDELRSILALGFPPDSKAFEAIGYREALMHLRGEIGVDAAVELVQRSTRQYAKRQWTWLRREAGVIWLEGFGNQIETKQSAFSHVEIHLKHLRENIAL